jgi:hypothetical protein
VYKRQLLLNGHTIAGKFPSREAAEVAHLEQEAPEALDIARAIARAPPQRRSRVLRAVQLVASNYVLPAKMDGQYRVLSQSGSGEFYAVKLNGSLSCTCYDSLYRAPLVRGFRMCKHIIAAGIYRKLNQQGG